MLYVLTLFLIYLLPMHQERLKQKRLFSASTKTKTQSSLHPVTLSKDPTSLIKIPHKQSSKIEPSHLAQEVEQNLLSNPDIYFKPQVKNDLFKSVVDIYLTRLPTSNKFAVKPKAQPALLKAKECRLNIKGPSPMKDNRDKESLLGLFRASCGMKVANQKKGSRYAQKRNEPLLMESNNEKKASKASQRSIRYSESRVQKLPVIRQSNDQLDSNFRKVNKDKRSTTEMHGQDNPEMPHFAKTAQKFKDDSSQFSFEDSYESDFDTPIELATKHHMESKISLGREPLPSQQRRSLRKIQKLVNEERVKSNISQIKHSQTSINIYTISNREDQKGGKLQHKVFNEKQEESNLAHQMINTIEKVTDIGLPLFWTSHLHQRGVYQAPIQKSLRHELFSFVSDPKNPSEQIVNIIPRQAYHKLFDCECEYFIDIVRSLAQQLLKMRGQVISNRLSLDNVYRLAQKDIRIGDWGCAAVRRELCISGQNVEFKEDPILADESGWLINPENLSPQLVALIMEDRYTDIWSLNPCPEVWSIGLIIFELLYMVPIWMPMRASVGKRNAKRGILYDQNRRLEVIYREQQKIPYLISKWLREERNNLGNVREQLLTIMKMALQTDISKRLTLEQVLQLLPS